MSLREYQHKRNFSVTREPRGGKAKAQHTPIFVVQLHHASHRHYDFRLQIGDVLKSWAVPKGPSYDPDVKRLAVEVEDHPLAYATFEGDIPEGQYGAGHVQIFDHGTWSPLANDHVRSKPDIAATALKQLNKGHLQFTLDGEHLHGTWHLVRTRRNERQPQWMLFKGHDQFASKIEADDLIEDHADKSKTPNAKRASKRAAASSAGISSKITRSKASTKKKSTARTQDWTRLALELNHADKQKIEAGAWAPELAHSVDEAPEGADWLHETKWDGYRLLTSIHKSKIALWSRNALTWTDRVPDVRNALADLKLIDAQFDGELIAVKSGKSDFNQLQAVLAGESDSPIVYAIFDMPHINGVSLRDCRLLDRKELLRKVLATSNSPHLLFSEHHVGNGREVFALAAEGGLEGIISKRADSAYRAGRGNDWQKVKSVLSDEFAIVGYTQPRGSRKGVGALLLARPAHNNAWEFVGRMGSGFSDVLLKKLGDALPKLHRDRPTVMAQSLVNRDVGKATWVQPRYVVEVYYRGLGKEGLLRQASLKGLREDKSANDLRNSPDAARIAIPTNASAESKSSTSAKRVTTRERSAMQISESKSVTRAATAKGAKQVRSRTKTKARDSERSELNYVTHPERVVYPSDGITKLQVAEYYEHAMSWLLPQIANRPLSLIRCPSNVKTCFFQKHRGEQFGEHVHAVRIRNSEGGMENYLYIKDADGMRDLVQMNVLEFHPWGSNVADVERADMVTFDLDPGPRVSWDRVIEAAELLRDLLADIELQSFVKTSGGKGLHVVVPLRPAQPWNSVKQSCKHIAAAVTQSRPKEFIDTASKSQRNGKIFIDYLRNGRGATSVAAYSLRARNGAPVAMPLKWKEIGKTQSGADFTIANTPPYLSKRKEDPWQGMEKIKQQFKP